jgi:acyl-CoA synthetase (AMP-forming)/AMP-acid ligase II
MPGVELRIAEHGSGELLVRGPHVFRGYLDPHDNDDAFDREWFRTGDAAELRDDRLRVVGRFKELANRNGRKVSLAEVEDAFRAASGIELCAAFSISDAVTGERVAVAVQLLDERPLDIPATLDGMIAAGLAKWKLPESVVRYPTPFPMTATGKVQRRALSEADGDPIWRAERLERRRHAAGGYGVD